MPLITIGVAHVRRRPECDGQEDTCNHQEVIDLWDVDLPRMFRARVNDHHTRETSEGEGLLDYGESPRYQSLASYDSRQHGHHKRRPVNFLCIYNTFFVKNDCNQNSRETQSSGKTLLLYLGQIPGMEAKKAFPTSSLCLRRYATWPKYASMIDGQITLHMLSCIDLTEKCPTSANKASHPVTKARVPQQIKSSY